METTQKSATEPIKGPAELRVFVGGIAKSVSEAALASFFGMFGKVTACKIITDNTTNKSKGFGFVAFSTKEEADRAKSCGRETGLYFLGKMMNVEDAFYKQEKQTTEVE